MAKSAVRGAASCGFAALVGAPPPAVAPAAAVATTTAFGSARSACARTASALGDARAASLGAGASAVCGAPLQSGLGGAVTAPPAAAAAAAKRAPGYRRRLRATAAASGDAAASPGQVAVVTGATRGIGRAIALALGHAGCRVVVNYRGSRAEDAEAVLREIRDGGGDGMTACADMASGEDVEALFKAVTDAYGTVDILVNNAGLTRDALVMRMSAEQWQSLLDVNLTGVFRCTQAAAKIMLRKRTGRIVNIASVVGQIGNAGQANYAAAKGGILGLTKANAKEFAPRGVTVNAVAPGFIESTMTESLPSDEIIKAIPLGRLGKPDEVAGVVRFLACDDAASYITGHTFNVDGGLAIGAGS